MATAPWPIPAAGGTVVWAGGMRLAKRRQPDHRVILGRPLRLPEAGQLSR